MRRVLLAVGLLAVLTVSVGTSQPRGSASAHFHHVHVNSTDPAKTQEFYQKTFGAQPRPSLFPTGSGGNPSSLSALCSVHRALRNGSARHSVVVRPSTL